MTLKETAEKIESIMEFGEVPSYSVTTGQKYLWICRNDGQFHKGDGAKINGYGTFLGKFTQEKAEKEFLPTEKERNLTKIFEEYQTGESPLTCDACEKELELQDTDDGIIWVGCEAYQSAADDADTHTSFQWDGRVPLSEI